MEAHMAIKKDTLDGLLAGVTRRLFSPRTAYSTSSRKLWRNDPEGPRPLTHQRTQSIRIANMRRERLNVADRRQAEWGTGLEAFEAKRS
jgi:hypothetical protein